MRPGLTVLIPCKDEERNIGACIRSLEGVADELLVADSGSTDRTREIARRLGARIIEREYVNSADFKNWAIPQARHEWILLLDADERATEELVEEVKLTLERGPEHDGYRISRRPYFFGHPVRHSGWGSDSVIRLFRRDSCRYEERRVHAGLLVGTGRVGRLRGKLEHYTYWTFDQCLRKLDRYTTWAAEDLMERGRRAGFVSLTLRPAFRFFRQYVLQLGFLDGFPGLVLCALCAFYVWTKYAKLWVLQRGVPEPEPDAGGPQARDGAAGRRPAERASAPQAGAGP
jgi:glycosyltransferase involved in cell wall biosynthesis